MSEDAAATNDFCSAEKSTYSGEAALYFTEVWAVRVKCGISFDHGFQKSSVPGSLTAFQCIRMPTWSARRVDS